uniref:Ig-like domain-containing protein n=1 Tax=Equus caballus TaxID=9796 RepID=A0A9L0TEX1_HORSE
APTLRAVIPLFSECKAPKEDDVVSLACLVKGYFPEPVQVTWEPEMQNQKPWTFPAMKKGQEYIHVFSLTTWWKPGSHSCTVHHKASSFRKKMTFQEPGEGSPQQESFSTRCPHLCLHPAAVPPGGGSLARGHTQPCLLPREEGPLSSEQECQNHTHPPSIYLLHPPLQGLWLKGEATFTCLVVGDDLKDAHLSWELSERSNGMFVESGPLEKHTNGSQSRSSRLALPRSSWAMGTSVTCKLSYPNLLMTQLLPTAASAPRSLTVHALTTPGLNASPGATSWLQCKVSGFSPPEIVLTWLEGQREVDPSWFATARPTAQPGNTTFQTWSILLVPTIPGPPTATYTCVVGHEASRQLLNTSWSLDTGGESHRGTGASVPQSWGGGAASRRSWAAGTVAKGLPHPACSVSGAPGFR